MAFFVYEIKCDITCFVAGLGLSSNQKEELVGRGEDFRNASFQILNKTFL